MANQSPRIDKNNMTPDPTEGPKVMTTKCNAYLFFAQVFDPDPQDTLYWRVFLDYYHQQPGAKLATEIRTAKSGTVISFNVDPNDPAFFTTGTFSEVHVVELFVADRPFDTLPRAPYGRNVEDPGLTDSFVWAIDLSSTADCISGQGGG